MREECLKNEHKTTKEEDLCLLGADLISFGEEELLEQLVREFALLLSFSHFDFRCGMEHSR